MTIKELKEKLKDFPDDMEVGYQWEAEVNHDSWVRTFGDISDVDVRSVDVDGEIFDGLALGIQKKLVLS
jgi:hypothetical protein